MSHLVVALCDIIFPHILVTTSRLPQLIFLNDKTFFLPRRDGADQRRPVHAPFRYFGRARSGPRKWQQQVAAVTIHVPAAVVLCGPREPVHLNSARSGRYCSAQTAQRIRTLFPAEQLSFIQVLCQWHRDLQPVFWEENEFCLVRSCSEARSRPILGCGRFTDISVKSGNSCIQCIAEKTGYCRRRVRRPRQTQHCRPADRHPAIRNAVHFREVNRFALYRVKKPGFGLPPRRRLVVYFAVR